VKSEALTSCSRSRRRCASVSLEAKNTCTNYESGSRRRRTSLGTTTEMSRFMCSYTSVAILWLIEGSFCETESNSTKQVSR
jgi:hypothetical protein